MIFICFYQNEIIKPVYFTSERNYSIIFSGRFSYFGAKNLKNHYNILPLHRKFKKFK